MKQITLLLLGLIMMTSASAAEYEYVPLVREGVKWVEYYNNTIENTQSVTTYQFSGNIEIGGNIYSKLFATKVSNVTQNEIPIAYIREEDKKVYCIPVDAMIFGCVLSNEFIGEYLIYNFNDITSPYTIDEYFMSPITMEQMTLGDKYVNLYHLGGIKSIAEGIGCLDNVFYDPWSMTLPDGSHTSLAWFEDNGEILFKGEGYEAAKEFLSNHATYNGDVDGDGHITSADVTALYDFLLGIINEAPASYDVDGDGVVTTADITAIYNVILGEQ
jgi:hypothetical protein